MGTTADKLNKLKATKEAIRTAINNKGGTLTETDTFASYATAIDNIQSGGGNPLQSLLDKAKSARGLFYGTTTSNVQYTPYHYMNYSELADFISSVNTSSCTDMSYMFYYCSSLTTIPLLDTSNVTNMHYMFYNCKALTTIPQLDTSKCTDMSAMFYNCNSLTSISLLNTSKVTDMSSMFYNCNSLTTIPHLDTSNVTDFDHTFSGCSNLTSIPQLVTSKATNMGYMYDNCSNLTTIPQVDTSVCTSVRNMFQYCSKLKSIDITHMKITQVLYSQCFAKDCYSLTKLIIRNMDKIPVIHTDTFSNCYHFYGTTNATYNPEGLKDGRIYVPDDKVEELKVATNWSVFADIIVPLSTLVEE